MKSSNQLAETISAAARVGALVLAITVFAVIWETDGKSRDRFLAERDIASSTYRVAAKKTRPITRHQARHATTVPRVSKVLSATKQAAHKGDSQISKTAPSPEKTNINVANSLWSNLKLPDSIAPGNYRIVDTLGRVEFMQLGNAAAAGNGPMLYTVESNGVTTFFIRLDTIPADVQTATNNQRSRS